MKVSVKQHGTSHRHDSLNCAFGNAILVMSAHTCETLVLVEFGEIGCVVGRGEDTVVALVRLDADAHVETGTFKGVFGF
jgi:hypothetical protein